MKVTDLTIKYDNLVAVDAVSFDLPSGTYLCIVGSNGSGKSTLVKGLLGLIKPASGEIIIPGGVKIGYLPQGTLIEKDFPASVFEVVLTGRQRRFPLYSKKDKQEAEKALKKLSVDQFKNVPFGELSGGQQRRVLLARALCAAHEILVLDEPVSSLDPVASAEFYTLIAELHKSGMTIIMVSHDVNSAVKYADKILHMGTKALFFGDTAEYLESDVSHDFKGCFHE